VAVTSAAFTLINLSACNSRPSQKQIASAEDGVYEAVIRHITTADGPLRISQIVFDDTLMTYLEPEENLESCKTNTRKYFSLEIGPPPYDSLADRAYRFFTGSDYAGPIRADTIQNFLERACTSGPLSRTFHTDLPRTFIPPKSIHFEDVRALNDESKSFEQQYPGASGIISFSHAGFDSTLDEAIVASAFVCGGLCGGQFRYVLRKKSGRWEVVNGLMVSVY
jgi:hypothetical protein